MTRKLLVGLFSIAAITACGGEDPAASENSQALLCVPKKAVANPGLDPSLMDCQPVTSVQDGSVHTASCTCNIVLGKLKCYGDTCP